MRSAFWTLGLALSLASNAGCYLSHTIELPTDAAVDAGLDAMAELDGGPPPICGSRCEAPVVLGQASHPTGEVPWAVLGVAVADRAVGVLVAEYHDDPLDHAQYTLWMASRDEHGLHKVSSDGGLSNLAALDGALFARASSFVAATVSLRDLGFDRFVGIHLTEWSSDGLLTRSEDVVDLSAVVPASCRSASGLPCNLQASFRRDGDSIVVTVTGVDQLHRTRFDLTSWEQEPLPPIALEDRRAGEPVSEAATEGGSELALVGGSAPMMPPRPVIAVPGPGSASIMVPGVVSDPPAIARVLEGELVGWRFVTDSERASNSAIIGWRTIGDSLLPAWRVRTAMGFPPSALEVFADGGTTPTLLWTSADPSDAEASNLHVMRIRDDVSTCDWLTAATGAHFSWPLREIVARPFAASMADDVVIAAVVGESSGYPLVLLEVSCE